MAIPATPSSFYAQTGNRTNYLSWNNSVGATSYSIQRSLDGIVYTVYATVTAPSYIDTAVTAGIQYWYNVAAVNVSGTSPYTSPQAVIPAPTAEMSLALLRLSALQRADKVGTQFITVPELNKFINLACYELYDLLITAYEDYFLAPTASFVTNGTTFQYPLPDGVTLFLDANNNPYAAPPFYKLKGVDLSISSANNAYVTLRRFNFQDRNKYVYPNSASTIYGVFNMQYHLMGSFLQFIPVPSASQVIRLWYTPRLPQLVADTDLTTIGFSGWLDYVIVRAAKYILDKEESDTSKLDQELAFLKNRIEEASQYRDEGAPATISDTRQSSMWGDGTGGYGPIGGF